MKFAGSLIVLCTLALSGFASAEPVLTGRASVIDGDTIEIRGQRIRLHGIDAPESSQKCADDKGAKYRCGQAAANFLYDVVVNRTVKCQSLDVDRYKRVIAECFVAIEDNQSVSVNGLMVVSGHALAYRRYSTDYVDAENHARSNLRGMWSGRFMEPWKWRKKQR